jgi:hypothetical protein
VIFINTLDKSAIFESIKEVGRWVLLYSLSWIITETLKQVGLVPEFSVVNVWVFSYLLPVRAGLQLGLTLLAKGVDKWLYEKDKTIIPIEGATGLTGF